MLRLVVLLSLVTAPVCAMWRRMGLQRGLDCSGDMASKAVLITVRSLLGEQTETFDLSEYVDRGGASARASALQEDLNTRLGGGNDIVVKLVPAGSVPTGSPAQQPVDLVQTFFSPGSEARLDNLEYLFIRHAAERKFLRTGDRLDAEGDDDDDGEDTAYKLAFVLEDNLRASFPRPLLRRVWNGLKPLRTEREPVRAYLTFAIALEKVLGPEKIGEVFAHLHEKYKGGVTEDSLREAIKDIFGVLEPSQKLQEQEASPEKMAQYLWNESSLWQDVQDV